MKDIVLDNNGLSVNADKIKSVWWIGGKMPKMNNEEVSHLGISLQNGETIRFKSQAYIKDSEVGSLINNVNDYLENIN